MAESQKFTPDELKSIQELQQVYNNKLQEFGQVRVQRLLLEQQLQGLDTREESLEQEYRDAQRIESELVEQLSKKYGTGQIDLATGEFTPTS